MKLLCVDIDGRHGAIVKVSVAVVTADWWRGDSDSGCAISTARHRLIVIRLSFPPSLIRREQSNWTGCSFEMERERNVQ